MELLEEKIRELEDTVRKIKDDLIERLKEHYPEHVTEYQRRIDYALGNYPPNMKLENIYRVLRMYMILVREGN